MNIRILSLKSFKFLLILIFLPCSVTAHPWKPAEYIIIDTDGGIDDFRTINLLLASPAVRILGISCSNGVLSAEQTHQKLLALLETSHHEGLLTSINTNEKSIAKRCSAAVNFDWGNLTRQPDSIMSHTKMLNYILEHTKDKITFLNLGSLRTVTSYFRSVKNLNNRTKNNLWLASYPDIKQSFNYLTDTSAWDEFKSQKISLRIIDGSQHIPGYESDFPERLQTTGLPHALMIASSLKKTESPVTTQMYDETGAVYLHFTELFRTDTLTPDILISRLKSGITKQFIGNCLLQIIKGKTVNQNQLLTVFPLDSSEYAKDIKPVVENTINNFGTDEWIACVMTMELHRHVGTYALIGAKMGIRVREYFGAGIDEMKIISYAGSNPPFSCLNDGLQVSTGATLGHGLIQLDNSNKMEPIADFEYLGQRIRIKLKDIYKDQVKQEIKEAQMLYGLESDNYWEMVRLRTIYYWSHWDRNTIFEISKIP